VDIGFTVVPLVPSEWPSDHFRRPSQFGPPPTPPPPPPVPVPLMFGINNCGVETFLFDYLIFLFKISSSFMRGMQNASILIFINIGSSKTFSSRFYK
jgi:hypothetical protein